MEYKELTVQHFIEKTGSSEPTPGGGSIAALTAATGAALVEMMANLTIGKKGYEDVQEEMVALQQEAKGLSARFLELLEKDTEAFQELMAAYRLPKESDAEKAHRAERIQETTKMAALVPFTIGELAYDLFRLADAVVARGNTNAITDGAIAGIQARAAVKSAFLNVKINLGSIKDSYFVEELQTKMATIESAVDEKEKTLLGQLPY